MEIDKEKKASIREFILKTNTSVDADDICELIELIDDTPKVIVDIGTWAGGSTRIWREIFNPEILITTDKDSPPEHFVGTNAIYLWNINDQDALVKIREILKNRQVDFLFIDGGHEYDKVKYNWEYYKSLVRTGGIVAFHDVKIIDNPTVDVYKLWDEIKVNHKYKEIRSKSTSTGIGVIFL